MKLLSILFVAVLCSTLDFAYSASCSAPAPFILNDSGPFGYTCDDKLIKITALNLEAVQFPSVGTVVVKKDFSYTCCNSNPGGCGQTSWTVPSPYRIASSNFLRADGYCAQAGAVDQYTDYPVAANTPDCQVDKADISTVCGTRTWCGCRWTSCAVTPLGRDLIGTVRISGWGDCTNTTIYGPLNAYTQTVALNYDCFAPPPFSKGASGAYGYTCNATGHVILTGLGNIAALSFNSTEKTVVVEKKFQYGCCNSLHTCEGVGKYASWNLPAGFAISTRNFLKADGWCAQAYINDNAGPRFAANTPDCNQDNANIGAVCGTRANCGCQWSSCAVLPLPRKYSGNVIIEGWGDCTTTNVYGPSNTFSNTISLSYGN